MPICRRQQAGAVTAALIRVDPPQSSWPSVYCSVVDEALRSAVSSRTPECTGRSGHLAVPGSWRATLPRLPTRAEPPCEPGTRAGELQHCDGGLASRAVLLQGSARRRGTGRGSATARECRDREERPMDLRLKGDRVLVTGGSKGIGSASARCSCRKAARSCWWRATRGGLPDTAAELKSFGKVVDLRRRSLEAGGRQRVADAYPDVSVLVNDAGAIPGGGLLDLTLERWQEGRPQGDRVHPHDAALLDADQGPGLRHDRQHHRARPAAVRARLRMRRHRRCRADAFTGTVGGKAVDWGVHRSSRSMRRRPDQARIISLSKARAKASLGDGAEWQEVLTDLPLNRLGGADEIAAAAAFLASPACGYVSGATLDVDGGRASAADVDTRPAAGRDLARGRSIDCAQCRTRKPAHVRLAIGRAGLERRHRRSGARYRQAGVSGGIP